MATLKDVYGRILYHYNPKEGEDDTIANALTVAALRKVKLPLLDLRGQLLENLNLSELISPFADLLEGVILTEATLKDVILRGATIDDQSLQGAIVRENIITH